MNLITILILNTRPHMKGGAANGYVVVPCGHPYHRLNEDQLSERVDIHGGWTFCDTVRAVKAFNGESKEIWAKELAKYPGLNDDDKIFGFDTFHLGDDLDRWPLNIVQAVITKAASQIQLASPEEVPPFDVGEIGNYYGGLRVKKSVSGQAFWSIENWDGEHWEEIPDYLYNALLKFSAGGES